MLWWIVLLLWFNANIEVEDHQELDKFVVAGVTVNVGKSVLVVLDCWLLPPGWCCCATFEKSSDAWEAVNDWPEIPGAPLFTATDDLYRNDVRVKSRLEFRVFL